MQYVVDNYDTIAEAALIVPMDDTQAERGEVRAREARSASGGGRTSRWKPATRTAGSAAPGALSLGATRRRWGEEVDPRAAVRRRGDLRPDHARASSSPCSSETIAFFEEVGLGRSSPTATGRRCSADPQFGIWQLINGTFLITGIAILVAIPLGLGSAVYLSEYASPAGAEVDQADARGAGRGADGRLRLLRPDLRHPDDPQRRPRRQRRSLQRARGRRW